MSSFSANTEELSLFYHSVVHWGTDYTDTDSTDTQYLYQRDLMIQILSVGGIGVSVISAPVNGLLKLLIPRWSGTINITFFTKRRKRGEGVCPKVKPFAWPLTQ